MKTVSAKHNLIREKRIVLLICREKGNNDTSETLL